MRAHRSSFRAAGLAALLAAVCLPAALAAQLTVRVTRVPAETPPGATLYVAGGFNGWQPAAPGYALAPAVDGTYAVRLPDSVRGHVEFKITRGSWATVEADAAGADVPNRTAEVPASGAAAYNAAVAGWHVAGGPTDAPPRAHTASPSVHVLADSFVMPQLGRARRVWLYLPPGYAASAAAGRRYPVLYLQDGQNVFDAATSFAGEWGVDESLDSVAARGGAGAIVVAVDNGGPRRVDEYDPWRAADSTLGGGAGAAYADFLARTLKPYVDAHYRTLADAPHTGVLGSSLGGLISLYAALAYPGVFGRAGVFSCACWIARPQLLAYVAAHPAPRGAAAPHFYFVVGARETADGGPARDQALVVDALAAAGYPAGTAVRAVVRGDGQHAEWFWRREFPAAYAWLLGDAGVR